VLNNIILKTLRDKRRSMLFWGTGLVALAIVVTTLLLPSITAAAEELKRYFELMPQEVLSVFGGDLSEISTPEGFLKAEIFFLVTPLFFLVFTIGFGAGAIAGEEEQGTLDLLLANPLSRRRVVLEKFGALSAGTILLAIFYWVGLVIGITAVNADVSLLNLAATCFSVALLGIAFGTLSLAVGCATGKRGPAMAAAGGLAVVAFGLNAMAPTIDFLKPFRGLSPFYYYIGSDPLVNGLNIGHAGVLIGLTAVFIVVGLLFFERRDLSV
jgi:ABC-2 type transport system permease protein